MNPLTWLNPTRWLATIAVVALLATGGYLGYRHLVARAVAAQKAADEAVLNQTIGAANAAAQAQQTLADAETALRNADAQRRIHDLETDRAAVAGRADAFARQLRDLRAAESQRGVGLSNPSAIGQEPRPHGVPGLSAPVQPAGADPIDSALMARLAQAEQLRLGCVRLWEQAQADRKGQP